MNQNELTELNKYISKKNEDCYEALARKDSNIALCLGAGVTSCIVGEWSSLLNEIATARCCLRSPSVTLSLEVMREYINKLHCNLSSNVTALEIGEYLACNVGDPTAFANDANIAYEWREILFAGETRSAIERIMALNTSQNVDENLYDGVTKFCIEQMKATSGKFKDKLTTLEAVLEMCIYGKVNHIIIYNFDTILDRLLLSDDVYSYFQNKKQKSAKKRSLNVYCSSFYPNILIKELSIKTESDQEPINLYHVHGILDGKIPLRQIIFSEKSYDQRAKTALNWNNVLIAKLLQDSHLVCIGFSGTDDDFRNVCRMIKVGKNENRHRERENKIMLIRSIGDLINLFADNENDSYVHACIYNYIDMIERYYKEQFDISHLWVSKYEEISQVLQRICS